MAALHLVQVSILIVLHVLHVLFTFVSFVLSSASKLFSRPRASVTGLSSSSAQRKPPPRHVSLILVPPRSGTHQADLKLEEVMLESIRRLLTWAAEEGVEECSVFEPGPNPCLPSMAAFLSRTLSCLAPTSPQATQSPPLSPNSVHTQEPFSTTSALSPSSSSSSLSSSFSHSSFLSPPPSSSSSPPSLSSSVSSLLSPPSTKDVLWSNGMLKMQVPLYSVSVSRQSSKKTISLVLMTAETSYDVLVQISRDLARNPKRRQPLDVKQLDRLIHEKLPFQTSPSPDLLLIHRLSTPSLWARLALSISPSWGEIDGLRLWDYPPWGLRVTEIYQTSYSSIFSSLASSKLSFFGTRSIRPLGPEDWAQALRAWDGVEQRFGK